MDWRVDSGLFVDVSDDVDQEGRVRGGRSDAGASEVFLAVSVWYYASPWVYRRFVELDEFLGLGLIQKNNSAIRRGLEKTNDDGSTQPASRAGTRCAAFQARKEHASALLQYIDRIFVGDNTSLIDDGRRGATSSCY